jgi:phosphopantothenoylcysteine decarboxylase
VANVLVGATGSVAAVKVPELAAALADAGHAVRVVATDAALYFFDPAELPQGTLFTDADEWPGRGEGRRYARGGAVLHIELRRWADAFVLAPLDANTLAKLAAGLCDNCLTCVWRAWDPARPAVLAPAMNTLMWEHPLTRRHLSQVAADATRLRVVPPVEKELACGDVGVGAMAPVAGVVAAIGELLAS